MSGMPSWSPSCDSRSAIRQYFLVADTQDHGREDSGGQRTHKYADFGELLAFGPGAKCEEFADEQRNGESDAGQHGESEHIEPFEVVIEFGFSETRHDPGATEGADPDAQGDRIGEGSGEFVPAAHAYASGEEREDRDRERCGDGPEVVFELFGEAGPGTAVTPRDRHSGGKQDPGDGGMDA